MVEVTRKALGMPGRAAPAVLGRGNFLQRVLQQSTSTNASSPRRKMRRSGTARTSRRSAVVVAQRTVAMRRALLEHRQGNNDVGVGNGYGAGAENSKAVAVGAQLRAFVFISVFTRGRVYGQAPLIPAFCRTGI